MNRLPLLAALAASLTFASQSIAHHSSAPHFDRDQELSVTGAITELKYVNPHAYIYFEVEENNEMVEWRCELPAATMLGRRGWKPEMFEAGKVITVNGAPARREDNVCYLNNMVFEDGTVITRAQDMTQIEGFATAEAEVIEEVQPAERPKYLANGQPNLEGPWITGSFGRRGERIRPEWVPTEAGAAAAASYEMEFDDPILRCHYVNMFDAWNHDENVNDITQEEDKIVIQYGFMDVVRTIHLNMDEHPADLTPSATGHSIGRWEGDTLIVDTIGFEEGVLSHQNGTKHSDQMHAVERFYFDEEKQRLVRDYSVTDPLYLVGTANGQDYQHLADRPYSPYNCVELSGDNNIRPSERTATPMEEAPAVTEEPAEKPWWQFWD